jgi:hypothetical protein
MTKEKSNKNQIKSNQIKSNFIHQVTLNKHKMHKEFDLMLALNRTDMRTHTNAEKKIALDYRQSCSYNSR